MFNWFDLLAIILGFVFILAFWRLGFGTALKSFLGFVVSIVGAVLLTKPVVSVLDGLGWRENVYTPPLVFILLLVIVWGVLTAVSQRIWTKKPALFAKIASIPVAVAYAFVFVAIVSQILPTFVGAKTLEAIKQSKTNLLFEKCGIDKFFGKFDFGQDYLDQDYAVLVPRQDNVSYKVENLPASAVQSGSAAQQDFLLINQSRRSAGKSILERDNKLDQLAADYAREILSSKQFSHYDSADQTPEVRARKEKINFNYLGENLAIAQTIEAAHQGLMDSPGHRANIEQEAFRRVGVAVFDLGGKGKLVVEEFTN